VIAVIARDRKSKLTADELGLARIEKSNTLHEQAKRLSNDTKLKANS